MAVWDAYLSLSSQERTNIAKLESTLPPLLLGIQSGQEPPTEIRRKLIASLLASLSPSSTQPHSTALTPASPISVLLPTLSTLKFLGRNPAGSEELAREKALTILLSYGGLTRVATTLPPKQRSTKLRPKHGKGRHPQVGLGIMDISEQDVGDIDEEDPLSIINEEEEKDPLTASEAEALRCLCNTLTLHPTARDIFPSLVTEDHTWSQGMVRLLAVPGAAFLTGRLLFLLTSKPGEAISELVESGDTIYALEEYAYRYIALLKTSPSTLAKATAPSPSDILREHFKLTYNLTLQYSRQSPRPPAGSGGLSPSPSAGRSSLSPSLDESELSDVHSDDPSAGGASGSRPSSPLPNGDAKSPGRKKRFWNKSGSNGSASTSPHRGGEEFLSKSPPSESPKRSKSPKLLAKKLKNVVTGSSSSKSSPVPSVPSNAPNLSSSSEGNSTGELSMDAATYFLPLFHPYLTLSCILPLGGPNNIDPKDPSQLVRSAFNTLLNFPIQLEELDHGFVHSWMQPIPGAKPVYPSLPPLASRLLDFLQRTCDAWFPTDVLPRDPKARQDKPAHPDDLIPKGTGEASRGEEILGPLMLMLRKVSLLTEPAIAMKELLLPDDIDREVPLERRTDLTGHLVRLLSSIMLPNTAYGVGEFLYNLCERDPALLSTTIGYGNASGFLQNRGELIPPPSMPDVKNSPKITRSPPTPATSTFPSTASASSSNGNFERPPTSSATPASTKPQRPVNPITGAYETPDDPNERKMTDAEKEREAERLYVLFDRMAKTGVMNVENPVDKARAEGRFEETTEDREAELAKMQEEEDEEERQAMEEMRRYKERKAKAAAAAESS
ncbi:hypothetical protein T439DRAFT_318490 [Meredithblackwellia eburnea MCA 4105]